MEPFDTTRPNIARVWDYWLGGKDNFAADRELAEKMLAVHPVSAQMARENRQFLGRARSATWRPEASGSSSMSAPACPTALNTHDIARHVEPHARVAYVDNDPVVISHARSLLAKSPGVIAVPGDMRDPGNILADAGLTELIDLAEPACVIFSAVLHFADPANRPQGGCRVRRGDRPGQLPDHLRRFRQPVGGRELHLRVHGRAGYTSTLQEEIRSFFDGLELVPPGVVAVRNWCGGGPALDLEPRTATFLGGVARKANAH